MTHAPFPLAAAVARGNQAQLARAQNLAIVKLDSEVRELKEALAARDAEIDLLNSRLSAATDKQLLLLNKLIDAGVKP